MIDADGPRIACVSGVSHALGAALAAELLARGFEVIGLERGADATLEGPAFRLLQVDLADSRAVGRGHGDPCIPRTRRTRASAGRAGQQCRGRRAHGGARCARRTRTRRIARREPHRTPHPRQRVRARARIVNVSSGAAIRPLPGCVAYCAAKAGLEMIASVAAAEGADGVDTLTLRPGIIDTPMQAYMRSRTTEALPIVGVFRAFHAEGRLQSPVATARRIVEKAVLGNVPHGAILSVEDPKPGEALRCAENFC